MANNTELFKTSRRKIQQISSQLSISQTTTGRMVILGETNQAKLKEAVSLLDQAAKIINQIR